MLELHRQVKLLILGLQTLIHTFPTVWHIWPAKQSTPVLHMHLLVSTISNIVQSFTLLQELLALSHNLPGLHSWLVPHLHLTIATSSWFNYGHISSVPHTPVSQSFIFKHIFVPHWQFKTV